MDSASARRLPRNEQEEKEIRDFESKPKEGESGRGFLGVTERAGRRRPRSAATNEDMATLRSENVRVYFGV